MSVSVHVSGLFCESAAMSYVDLWDRGDMTR